MHFIKFVLILTITICLSDSCIEPYVPSIENQDKNKYVVSGRITDLEGFQIVTVSKSTSVQNPKYLPLSGCSVKVSDNQNNVFTLDEFKEGQYRVWIGKEFLNPGASYKVDVITPANHEIVSEFDTMSECPEIDSIYFKIQDILTNNPYEPIKGIQFYIDLEGKNSDSRFYKWEYEETWEHRAAYPKEFWYDGQVHRIVPPDSSEFFCWSTYYSNQIFTLSTNNLIHNRYQMFPLHYVRNKTARLVIGYSLFVNQMSLSEIAFIYWDQLRTNTSEMGGLYERQPIAIKGNLKCKNDPGQDVLGIFYAVSIKSKRIFISNIEDLEIDYPPVCRPEYLKYGLLEIYPSWYPAYYLNIEGAIYYLDEPCINCLSTGGTTIKPDFWPN